MDSEAHCRTFDANSRHTAPVSCKCVLDMSQAHKNLSRKFTDNGNTWSSQLCSSQTLMYKNKIRNFNKNKVKGSGQTPILWQLPDNTVKVWDFYHDKTYTQNRHYFVRI